MSRQNSVEMGWGARPIKEQHPDLSDDLCQHFDRDNQDLSRLVLRGIITPSQAAISRQRYVKKVGEAIRSALAAKKKSKEPTT